MQQKRIKLLRKVDPQVQVILGFAAADVVIPFDMIYLRCPVIYIALGYNNFFIRVRVKVFLHGGSFVRIANEIFKIRIKKIENKFSVGSQMFFYRKET